MFLDTALSNYQCVSNFEQANVTGDYVRDVAFQMFAWKCLLNNQSHSGDMMPQLARYDDIIIGPREPGALSTFLGKMKAMDSVFFTRQERKHVDIVRHLKHHGVDHNPSQYYGQARIISGLARSMFGFYGAFSLLVPLIALTFIESTNYRLLATCLFVFTFNIIVTFFTDATKQELLGATAAYAAVLVVFVGSALGSTG